MAFALGFFGGYAAIGPRMVAEFERLKQTTAPAAPEPPNPAALNHSVGGDASPDDAAAGLSDAKGPADGSGEAIGRVMAGYLDRTGQWAVAPQFADARPFKDGMGRVAIGDRWGFVDPRGQLVIPASFVQADDFSEGMALVRNDQQKLGFIDRAGTLVIDYVYDIAWPFRNGLALVGDGRPGERKYRLIRKKGDTAARVGYEPIATFSEGMASARVSDNQIGFFDTTGRVVVKLRLDAARDFTNGMAVVVLNGKTGAMNHEWRVVIAPTFDAMTDFAEGMAGAAVESHYGFVDKKGRFVIAATYDDARPFSEGLAAVSRDKHYGYIDHTGSEIIEPKFDEAGPFSHGLAAVRVGNRFGYIDPQGRWVIEPKFRWAGDFGDQGLAPASIVGVEKETIPAAAALPPSDAAPIVSPDSSRDP
jgi:hypothetical protein